MNRRRTTTINDDKTEFAAPERRTGFSLLLAAGLAAGCPTGDPDAGGGTDTDDPVPELPGVRLDCCYELASITHGEPPEYAIGCVSQGWEPCIDPVDPGVDTNGNGTLEPSELQDACAMKCPNPLDFPFSGVPFEAPGVGGPIGIDPPYDGCIAISGEIDMEAATCDPTSPTNLDPWPSSSVPPTHEGSFTNGTSGNQADIDVNGVTQSVDYDGVFAFAISDCRPVRTREICVLDLHRLQLDLVGNPVFGNYEVDGAVVDLATPSAATATFTCDSAGCFGTFDFSVRTRTTLNMNLNWDQTTLSTGKSGGGGLALGERALGELTRVDGELDLDATKTSGTLRLHGTGRDVFGGDFAEATFDLTGPVTPFTL